MVCVVQDFDIFLFGLGDLVVVVFYGYVVVFVCVVFIWVVWCGELGW